MNWDLFLIQNAFEEFNFSQNYFYLAQLGDENPSMTRNPNPKRIQENNECRSTKRNPSLTTIHDVARNPNPKRIQDNNECRSTTRNPIPTRIQDRVRNPNPTRIQDIISNPCPIRIEDTFDL